jgi:hypothetical protein
MYCLHWKTHRRVWQQQLIDFVPALMKQYLFYRKMSAGIQVQKKGAGKIA